MLKPKTIENTLVYFFFFVFLFLGYGVLVRQNESRDSDLRVHYLDVGQGDSTLIEAPSGATIIIDGGPDKSVLMELGSLLPAFGKRIDSVFLTHPHADHLAGLNYLLGRYEVGSIYLTGAAHNTPDFESFLERIKENRVQTNIFVSGDEVCYELVCIGSLWPDEGKISKLDLNDSSMILNVNYGESDFVFFGDSSAEIQESLLSRLDFDAEVVKVSHHGSRTGTSEEVLNILSPEVAVISAGKDNYFNHPAESVLELLSGQEVLRTDQVGTITIKSDGNTIQY